MRLVHSHSHEALLGIASRFLSNHSPLLVIAPSRGSADDFVRRYLPARAAGIHRATLTHLAAQLASRRLSPGERPASTLALEALTARIIETLRRDSAIPYFDPVAGTPGLARAARRSRVAPCLWR